MRNNQTLNFLTSVFFALTLLAIFSSTVSVRAQMSGDLDLSFGVGGKYQNGFGGAYDEARAVAIQSDGKIVTAGVARNFGANDFVVCRYNTDGTFDNSFDTDGYATVDFASNDEANAVAIQTDGKIVVAGRGSGGFAVSRFNSDGSLDTTFDGDGKVYNTSYALTSYSVAVQTDGKIVVAGSYYNGSNNDFGVIRLNANGSFDTTFGTGGFVSTQFGTTEDVARAVAIQSDGKIVVAGGAQISNYYFAVARFNTNGSLDTTFDTDGKVTTSFAPTQEAFSLAIQPDNKIILGGITNIGAGLARYNSNGSLDTTFDGDGTRTNSSHLYIRGMALQPDGKIVTSGSESSNGNDFRISRYNSNGSLDTGFDSDGMTTIDISGLDLNYGIALQTDGKIVAVGSSYVSAAVGYNSALVRLETNGALDTTFDLDGKRISDPGNFQSDILSTALQPDGKIIAAGYSRADNGDDFGLVRFNANGTLDTSFGLDGKRTTSINTFDRIQAVSVQSDGKIVAAGYAQSGSAIDFAVVRYNSNGSLDTTFDTDGIVTTPIGTTIDYGYAMTIQPDGKILVGGFFSNGSNSDFALIRYNTNGSLDTTFGTGGKATTAVGAGTSDNAYAIKLQPDGKIILAGNSNSNFALVRYNANGSLDTTFDSDGIVTTPIGTVNQPDIIYSIALQTDGKIVAAGESYNGSNRDWAIARYNPNGSLDTTFDTDGILITTFGTQDESARSVTVQPDGKIVVAGDTYLNFPEYRDFALARYNTDGSFDTTFSLVGRNHGFDLFAGDGKVTVNLGTNSTDAANALLIDANQKYVLAGSSNSGFGIARIFGESVVTAANAGISGRTVDKSGNGLARVKVSLRIARTGEIVTTYSSNFGYFNFEELAVGDVYLVSVEDNKRYVFDDNTRVVQLFDNVTDVNFVGSAR